MPLHQYTSEKEVSRNTPDCAETMKRMESAKKVATSAVLHMAQVNLEEKGRKRKRKRRERLR